ncbi:hypothetical protein DSO57_1003555 [Entomophthora muscae]|uniref:Uncharacterized protein n=1 Tax=Entomophthora muscae TaxID=34485 RepID=A0ACC2RZN7_9FUNG|nr:hypothetical protein DSO57_1003555 [Entomophthora muscae]
MFSSKTLVTRSLSRFQVLSARSFASSASMASIEKIVVIGAGLMGSGIVQVAAQANYKVVMVDQSADALKNGEGIIRGSLKRIAKKKFPDSASEQDKFIEGVCANYSTSSDAIESLKDTDLLVEAIVENLEVKRKLFSLLDQNAPAKTIFCSNTSSLPIHILLRAPKDWKGLPVFIFFNPVPQMKLVEVISTDDTSKEVLKDLFDFSKKIGKSPIACKDTPGFIVNRLLVPYMLEALRLYERGDATLHDIDTGMKLGAGYPMGPFELMDYVGLDTLKFITEQWYSSNPHLKGESLVIPSPSIEKLVSQGHLGRKSGKGFYDYSK